MTDYSFLSKRLPAEAETPWLVSGRCRVFFNPRALEIHLVQDYFPPDHPGPRNVLGGARGTIVRLPADPSVPVRQGGVSLHQRVGAVERADGSTLIELAVYREYRDTGGYITRQRAMIELAPEGGLRRFLVDEAISTRRFVFFGSLGDFKPTKSHRCGGAPVAP